MNGDLGANHFWKLTDESKLALTTGENSNMGEGWIEIQSDEYFRLALSHAKLAIENSNKTDRQ